MLSLQGWDRTHNPHNIRIVTREYAHRPVAIYPRGGDSSGDHLDILGNLELNRDLVATACGREVEPRIVSKINQIAEEIYRRRYGDQAS